MKKVGNYLLVSEIGKGQFGTVYKATKQPGNDVFAIKTVAKKKVNSNSKLRKLFDTEMAVMSKINHPNILHLYEYLETANNYYLVIQYCNNGDLETHVKKNTNLGEEESVYFLMQVMNGFKELHKHKIMHRDFKLANIFLNDDNLIIGDFGFAKSGVDMATTKLGSPITMAPELLNAGSVVKYTNKADLWSIGVCFYQMIFGKPPWNAQNLNDLKKKVKTLSGQNMTFPDDPPTSEDCQQLMKALIEPDPDKRIEWTDFFNHKLFKKQDGEKPAGMRSSVMFRNHEDKVAELFEKNQKEKAKEVQLVDPLDIELEVKKEEEEEIKKKQKEQEQEKAINEARQRYTHEKKIIVFIMHTCRKLRNLAKQRQYLKNASESLMFSGLMLLKKGIIKNELAISSIKHKVNKFKISNFEFFLETNNCRKILKELSKDNKLYYTLLAHLQKKLQSEIGTDNQRAKTLYEMSTDPTTTLGEVQPELDKETAYLVNFHSKIISKLPSEVKREFSIGLCDLYLSSESEKEFIFRSSNGIPFDWHEFERNFNMNFVNGTLEKALQIV